MRLVLLHQLPLEMYPPACNLLRFLAKHSGGDVWSITSTNQKGLVPFQTDGVRIRRYRFGKHADWVLLRWVYSLLWHFQAAWLLCRLRPAAVISVEPHSARCVALAVFCWQNRTVADSSSRVLHAGGLPASGKSPDMDQQTFRKRLVEACGLDISDKRRQAASFSKRSSRSDRFSMSPVAQLPSLFLADSNLPKPTMASYTGRTAATCVRGFGVTA